jgi:hypothetical protein
LSCDSCRNIEVKIKRQSDLSGAIHAASDLTRSGRIKYLGTGEFGDPFKSIANGRGWSDIVSNYFSCASCGQLFHLHAETYHGNGGAFEAVSEIKGKIQSDVYPS